MDEVKSTYPNADIKAWAFDEHRIGLKPVFRRIWALEGHRIVVSVNHRFKWSYVYGYVCPETGETHWQILPYVCVEEFNLSLADLAISINISENKQIILVMDRAGWHTSPDLVIPPWIHFVFLPPYTPELQPAERLWPLTNECLVNKYFTNIEELEDVQGRWCAELSNNNELIKSHTNFHWWPESENN